MKWVHDFRVPITLLIWCSPREELWEEQRQQCSHPKVERRDTEKVSFFQNLWVDWQWHFFLCCNWWWLFAWAWVWYLWWRVLSFILSNLVFFRCSFEFLINIMVAITSQKYWNHDWRVESSLFISERRSFISLFLFLRASICLLIA